MGNKLESTKFSLEKGFTGVSDPTATLSSITKGMQDVATWKKGIDDAEIKLKIDTANAYQESKKLATERLTGNVTVDAAILEALKSTQNRLYDNQKMVQNGMQTPTDNLIFRQNASSSYDTLSSYLQEYDVNFQQSIKELQGYTNDNGEYVKPTGGAFQAAIQRFQTTLGNPNLYKFTSSENGSLDINLYKTKINPTTNTRELVLDENNNPILDPSMSGIGSSVIFKKKNQKSPRVYMDDGINAAVAEGTPLNKAFQILLKDVDNYTGVVVDDARQNPNLVRLIDLATISGTTTVEQRMSILMDNMPLEKQQIPVMPNEVAGLEAEGIDYLNEKITYSYLDPATGETKFDTYNKYAMVALDPMSTLFMTKADEKANKASELAAQRIYKSAIYAGLQRKIVGRDLKPVNKSTPYDKGNKKLLDAASDMVGEINTTFGGTQQDIDVSIRTLQAGSNYKFQSQSDIMDGDVKVGVNMIVADDSGGSRTDSVILKVKDENKKYVDVSADDYGKQLYALYKNKDMPTYDQAKKNYIKNNTFIDVVNSDGIRAYTPKIEQRQTIAAVTGVNLNSSLNKDNEAPLTIIQEDLNKIKNSEYNVTDGEIESLSANISKALSAGETKYGRPISNYTVTTNPDTEKITITYGDKKTKVIDLSLKTIKGEELIEEIKNKINTVFEDLFPAVPESTKNVVTQGGKGKLDAFGKIIE